MFRLAEVEDDVAVLPSNLNTPVVEAVTNVINERYLDKVIQNVGLVIALYDITDCKGGLIYPSEGAARFKVSFRLVVFRPFVNEVYTGKLKSSDKDGLKISVGFFSDIHVPKYAMPDTAFFSQKEGLWVWKYDDNDLFYDHDETVRFKVTNITFTPEPPPPDLQSEVPGAIKLGTAGRPYVPMLVEASVSEEGCGCTIWWDAEEDQEE